MFKKSISLALVAIIVATVGLFSAPAKATASAKLIQCPVGDICIYDQSNWDGYRVFFNPLTLAAGRCYNLDSTWDKLIDSVWWNDEISFSAYAEFYRGRDCTISAVTRVYAKSPQFNQMHSCAQSASVWNGPCNGTGPNRIRSWAFTYWG